MVITLQERRHLAFTLPEVMEITGLKAASASSFIRALVNRGVAARLRPGLFQLVPFELGREKEYLGNPYVVARELMAGRDYYVSHASAMDIHRMTTQPQLVVYVASPMARRKRAIFGTEFRFIRCPRPRFFGFSEQWVDKQNKVLVSDLERTVLDGLKAPEYCGGVSEVAKGFWMRRSDMDVRKLVDYTLRLDINAVIGRLGYLMERLEIGAENDRTTLQERLGKAYVLLDPTLPAEGKFLAKWRLRLNVAAEELRAVLQT
ncbi:MAG TPA: transcriptional regulator [Elusimicrobia bacterium]|nr:transcriptional regulator [Elusimicrobiota bacterium]